MSLRLHALTDCEGGGSFMVCGEDVVCVLDNVLARGTSYGEAALRALSQVAQEQMRHPAADSSVKSVP